MFVGLDFSEAKGTHPLLCQPPLKIKWDSQNQNRLSRMDLSFLSFFSEMSIILKKKV